MKRFYPDSLPPFLLEPRSDHFQIQKIGDDVGEGVVSLIPFYKGQVLFAFTGFLLNEITQYTLKVSDGLHLHDPFFMGKVLHSCNPNSSCDMESRIFTAVRDIEPGELITMDYMETETDLFKSFPCRCGAANCRGWIGSQQNQFAANEAGRW